ncbi:hypothetical protein [Methylovulum psychrotolerans]|uniref:Uncharacterized protein n=1 Tax=Methylovulum psychrotolerans TaxID=1704499 RepID=A0A2S5CQ06_9GAMM|nr:hypothetical protein [Methylovulum psychrotolerans]MBT9098512.1 hypothetical protein [Methylovulum psychrotolerans]POZ52899.1 hypothetical protein AADEFJLK_01510 [Methylovulum psychrotolerans]
MFNLQEALDNRLAALECKKGRKAVNQNHSLTDVSVDYIKRSLKQAGILNKKGKLVDRVII